MEKLEGKAQVAGAAYAGDIPATDGELYAAIVKAPYAPATFDPSSDVDTTEALVKIITCHLQTKYYAFDLKVPFLVLSGFLYLLFLGNSWCGGILWG